MAKRIMAGRRTPASRGNSTDNTDGPSAVDLLENKLTQLKSLLWCSYGDEAPWAQQGTSDKHRDNVIWIAADLAIEAADLLQECCKEWAAQRGNI